MLKSYCEPLLNVGTKIMANLERGEKLKDARTCFQKELGEKKEFDCVYAWLFNDNLFQFEGRGLQSILKGF